MWLCSPALIEIIKSCAMFLDHLMYLNSTVTQFLPFSSIKYHVILCYYMKTCVILGSQPQIIYLGGLLTKNADSAIKKSKSVPDIVWDTDNGLKLLIFQLSDVREWESLTLVQGRFLHYHLFYYCNYFYPLSSLHRPTTAIFCNWKDFSNSFPHGFFKRFCCFSFSFFLNHSIPYRCFTLHHWHMWSVLSPLKHALRR